MNHVRKLFSKIGEFNISTIYKLVAPYPDLVVNFKVTITKSILFLQGKLSLYWSQISAHFSFKKVD